MRRVLLSVALPFLLSVAAVAQEYPSVELFGGYSYFRPDGGGNFNGWNASVAGNANRWFGVVGDFSGHYASETILSIVGPGGSIEAGAKANIYNLLFGPRFTYRANPRVSPFAHILFGVTRAHVEGRARVGTVTVTISESDSAFAGALGGGFDVRLAERVGLRVVQAEYVLTRREGQTGNHFRVSTGIVFRFGSR